MKLFRHSAKDVFLVAQTLITLAIPIIFAIASLDFVWWMIFLPLHVLVLLCYNNTSVHHHAHWETFNNKKINRIYECMLSIAGAASLQVYRNIHLIHHKFVNDPPVSKDAISVLSHGKNGQAQNVWKFCLRRMFVTNFVNGLLKNNVNNMPLINRACWKRELIALSVFTFVLCCINLYYGLWWIFVVCPLMQFLNAAWHYGEHWGAHDRRGDSTQDSVGIYNWWYNALCFNSGLHQEHHYKPGMHWTKLPSVTHLMHPTRVTANGMHIFNVPWAADLKKLFKLSSN
jgi:fatty acid desaturase